jgi:lysozyme family protein
MRYSAIWPLYAKWWDAMVIKPARMTEFTNEATFSVIHKETYIEIQEATPHKVPWPMIAVIHWREATEDKAGHPRFDTYLGNGQSLARRTTEVPANRGPFPGPHGFFNGALDALRVDDLLNVIDWRLEKMLFHITGFNGWGYGIHPSPYIWGGTSVQVRGKYTSDRHYDATVWDTQPGCAPLLAMIAKLDASVKFVRET